MNRPLVAVPSYPRLPRGRVQGWADEGVGVPARYVDALHRAGAPEALFLPPRGRPLTPPRCSSASTACC